MDRPDLLRVIEPRGGKQFGQRLQRCAVIVVNPLRLVGTPNAPALGVSLLAVAGAERTNEATRRIAPVRPDRHGARQIEGGRYLSSGADADAVTRIDADQRIMDEIDPLAHRHAHEFARPGAGPAFVAVDHDETRIDSALKHCLADREKLPGVTDAQLESGRLAAGEPTHLADEGHHFQRRRKCPVRGRRDAVLAHADASDLGNFLGDLGGRKDATVSGLGALTDLELDHLDLIVGGDAREFFRIERAVAVAATEISGTDLPNQITAVLAMIGTDTALAGVMREAALFGTRVQRAHRVRTKRAKAHRRDIEDGCRIRLDAIRTADGDTKLLAGTNLRRHRMVHPFIAFAIDVLLGAERPLVEHHLLPLINKRAGVAAERHAVLLALEEVLPHFRPYLFQQKPDMGRDRVISQNRVVLLREIANAE